MDQVQVIQLPTQKIYKSNAVRIGAFFGGPLVAGYFIAENFKAFDEPEKARKAWIFTILATIVIFAIAFLLPNSGKSGEYLLPLAYAWLAYSLVQHYQGANIASHLSAGGETYHWGRTLLVTVIGLIVTLIALFCVFYATDSITSTEVIKTYGTAQNEVHFDKANMSAAESDKIGQALLDVKFFGTGDKKFVYVKKIGQNFEISIACKKTIETNPQIAEVFAGLRTEMQKEFTENKIVFNLVAGDLDNVVKRIE